MRNSPILICCMRPLIIIKNELVFCMVHTFLYVGEGKEPYRIQVFIITFLSNPSSKELTVTYMSHSLMWTYLASKVFAWGPSPKSASASIRMGSTSDWAFSIVAPWQLWNLFLRKTCLAPSLLAFRLEGRWRWSLLYSQAFSLPQLSISVMAYGYCFCLACWTLCLDL